MADPPKTVMHSRRLPSNIALPLGDLTSGQATIAQQMVGSAAMQYFGPPMSALGQKRTHAAQQKARLFYNFIGALLERQGYVEAECLRWVARGPASVEFDVSALGPPKIFHAFPKGRDASLSFRILPREIHEYSDTSYAVALLCACCERPS